MAQLSRRSGQRDDPAPSVGELLRMGWESFVATMASGVVVYVGYLAFVWLRLVLGYDS